ncbi:DUF3862 domain-containing protein [Alteromonas sp. a30]|uniref:DUF3862 domain-containing protein n=1 Tax=Alteromonas sp. a30 TaxID=2730917 RepID=UPI002282DFB5|nr:DUF3862 domain-containing protein [Alteromonas sp. a30]MCY7296448.1 DUF3862 domain-containing protein [Alteromonas sp. a30]
MKKALALSGLLAAALLLSGCSKLNQQNYDKLEMGMSLEEVESVIGKHDECSTALGTKTCMWGNEKSKYIKVSFMGNAAITFSGDKL